MKSYRVYLRQSDVPRSEVVCRQVHIDRDLIPIVVAHLHWLTRNFVWAGTASEIDYARSAIALLMNELVESSCGDPESAEIIDALNERIANLLATIQELEATGLAHGGGIGEEDCEDDEMACVTCIKRIRINDTGLLEVSYYTEVECADCWITIGNVPVADIFSTVRNALIDQAGKARENARINFGNALINKNQAVLRNCAKATALYDAVAEAAKAVVGVNNTWYSLGHDFGDWLTEIIPADVLKAALTALLPEVFVPVIMAAELIEAITGMSASDINELELAQWDALRETTICALSVQMAKAEELTSEELVSALTTIAGKVAVGAEVLARLTNAFDFLAFRELVRGRQQDLDCGCSQIVSGATGVPAIPPGSDYDWAKVLDFKLNDFAPEIVNIISEPEGLQGVYSPANGYSDVYTSKATGGWRRLRINIAMGASRNITSLDLHYEFERGVLSENAPGSPLSNINLNYYADGAIQKFTHTPQGGVFRWEGLRNVSDFEVNATCGYVETANEPVDPGGDVTYKKLIIRGLGTVPDGLASLPDE